MHTNIHAYPMHSHKYKVNMNSVNHLTSLFNRAGKQKSKNNKKKKRKRKPHTIDSTAVTPAYKKGRRNGTVLTASWRQRRRERERGIHAYLD